jgi:hypothetical protein
MHATWPAHLIPKVLYFSRDAIQILYWNTINFVIRRTRNPHFLSEQATFLQFVQGM